MERYRHSQSVLPVDGRQTVDSLARLCDVHHAPRPHLGQEHRQLLVTRSTHVETLTRRAAGGRKGGSQKVGHRK